MMKLTKMNTRGFTLIELLVVIAIIGILASVVLASLNTARDKGSDAAIQSTVSNIRAQAEIVGNQANGTVDYSTICANGQIANMIAEINAKSGFTAACGDVAGSWGFATQLKQGGKICVDSLGNSQTSDLTVSVATEITDGTDYACDGA